VPTIRDDMMLFARTSEQLREQADHNTGSINVDAMIDLCLLNRTLRFNRIAEVGTFIGNSTRAMAHGNLSSHIDTCDSQNDIEIPDRHNQITQHPRVASTEMFEKFAQPFDFIYLDGRLNEVESLRPCVTNKTIIGFDDFVGYEKGVTNMAQVHALLPEHWLIYEPNRIALLVNPAIFNYRPQ